MATLTQVQHEHPWTDTQSRLNSLVVGVGIFSVSGEAAPEADNQLPIDFRDYAWSAIAPVAITDDVLGGRSFSIEYSPYDLMQLSAEEDFTIPPELAKHGYRKHFWLDVPEARFAQVMWQLAESLPPQGPSLPRPRAKGFLGATWLRDISARHLVASARTPCIHPCNPPPQCRQTGCVCNRELRMCV